MARWLNRVLILAVLALFVVGAIAGYAQLVATGVLPPITPEVLDQLKKATEGIMRDATSVMIGLAIVIPVVITALAPFILAIRSEDVFTVIVSLVLVLATWGLVFSSRTSIDLCFAGLVYLASMMLSVGMYISKTVAIGLRRSAATSPPLYDPQ